MSNPIYRPGRGRNDNNARLADSFYDDLRRLGDFPDTTKRIDDSEPKNNKKAIRLGIGNAIYDDIEYYEYSVPRPKKKSNEKLQIHEIGTSSVDEKDYSTGRHFPLSDENSTSAQSPTRRHPRTQNNGFPNANITQNDIYFPRDPSSLSPPVLQTSWAKSDRFSAELMNNSDEDFKIANTGAVCDDAVERPNPCADRCQPSQKTNFHDFNPNFSRVSSRSVDIIDRLRNSSRNQEDTMNAEQTHTSALNVNTQSRIQDSFVTSSFNTETILNSSKEQRFQRLLVHPMERRMSPQSMLEHVGHPAERLSSSQLNEIPSVDDNVKLSYDILCEKQRLELERIQRERDDTKKKTAHNLDKFEAENLEHPNYTMEIVPGVHVRLHGIKETYAAITNDLFAPCACPCCSETLYCIPEATFVLCPTCLIVSPISPHEDVSFASHVYGPQVHPICNYNRCVGVGFTFDDLCAIRKEVNP